MSPQTAFVPRVLREYALLADGERGAVVGPAGDIVWLCAPTWADGAVFGSLLGGDGGYAITPQGRYVWGGSYETGSLIWRSRWVTDTGIVECREALAFPGDPDTVVLLRRIRAVQGPAEVDLVLDLRADYGKAEATGVSHSPGVHEGRVGELHFRWSTGDARVRHTAPRFTGTATVPAGGHLDLVLEIGRRPPAGPPPDAGELWTSTEDRWQEAVPAPGTCFSPTEVRHSLAVLRGLTSGSGGMVAAATSSLPERAEQGRNYDYRYVWIRDQCFAGQAAAAAGALPLLDDAVRFSTARLHEHGADLRPAYTATGADVPSQRRLDLSGYPGGFDIVGNHVNQQFQLDAFGELLLLLATAAGVDRLDEDGRAAAVLAADAIAGLWTRPDAGIWEIDDRPWTHSRLICVAGLRAAARIPGLGRAAGDWLTLADRIGADTAAHATHPSGRWQRSPDDPGLDGALLLLALRGAVPADDPRSVRTLDAYLEDLTQDGFAYRFRHGRAELSEAEGAFTFCGFVTAQALSQQGRAVEAARWFERMSAAAGPPQLFAEEYDVAQHQLRGNLPQAFVHALHVETAVRLAQA